MIRHVQIHFGLSVCNACASHTLLMSQKHNGHIAKFLHLEMVVRTSSAAAVVFTAAQMNALSHWSCC